MHWTEALTDRLKGKVKMVGATINCGGVYDVPAVPHVQSYLVALDLAGFKILQKAVSFQSFFGNMNRSLTLVKTEDSCLTLRSTFTKPEHCGLLRSSDF